jgi:starch-binding outer membrane protein, SusD/RagB family
MFKKMKSVNYKSTIIGLALAVSFGFAACKKSFLNEPVRNQTPEDFFANPDAPEQLVTAVYNQLYEWQQHSFSWIGITSIADDDAEKGSDPGDSGTDKDQLDKFTFTSSSLSFNEIWESNFKGIARANQALFYLPQFNNLPLERKNRYIGEVKFLRAYYYWNLVRTFGGVPKSDKLIQTQEDIIKANVRASADEIYAFIRQDLTEAMAALPSSYDAENLGRATRGACIGLLAKVALYQKDWAMAKNYSEQLITSGTYSLTPNYAVIWRESGEFNSESIWEINGKGTDPNKGITGYFVVQAPRGAGGLGWGFNIPSQRLVDAYEPGDVRKDATIIFSGQTLWDGFATNPGAPNPRYNYKAYISKTLETFNGNDNETNKNLRVLRLGEMYLIHAEACTELGDTAKARVSLNAIRTRAGLAPTTAVGVDQMREAVYKERRVEMAFEHDRLFDLRRTGRAGKVLREAGIPFVDGKHELYPIPQRQIDLSGGLLIQNPGY